MKDERQSWIKQLEEITDSDVYILFTSNNDEQRYTIASDLLPLFTDAIFMRRKGRRKNATIVLETIGGDTTVVLAFLKQLHENYKKVFGYVFNRCFSSGTIGMLATDEIHMSKYALLTPVNLQTFSYDGPRYKPLLAQYNAFVGRKPDEREMIFAANYPEEYLEVLLDNRYALQTIYPYFEKHCKPSFRDTTWEYFNGGAGQHCTKINRKLAISLGLRIKLMSDETEEILYNIINNYIKSTDMLTNILASLEIKDAHFETFGLTYCHYFKYQEEKPNDVQKTATVGFAASREEEVENKTVNIKRCIEYGWKKE
ncbi:MAG: hypothetical protein E7314_06395 [Clostridiales bacterium]|nr:hypothetical protein [Clostridiales bacterium]